MEGNLKKVITDLNKSRGVAEATSLTDANANPIAKVSCTVCSCMHFIVDVSRRE